MAYTAPITFTTGQTVTTAQLNTYVGDNISYLYAPTDTWLTLPVNAGFQQLSGTRAAQYRVVNGSRVQLRGTLQLVTGNFAPGNTDVNSSSPLPAGARPGQLRPLPVTCNGSIITTILYLTASGLLRFVTAATNTTCTWFSLEGIEFDVNN